MQKLKELVSASSTFAVYVVAIGHVHSTAVDFMGSLTPSMPERSDEFSPKVVKWLIELSALSFVSKESTASNAKLSKVRRHLQNIWRVATYGFALGVLTNTDTLKELQSHRKADALLFFLEVLHAKDSRSCRVKRRAVSIEFMRCFFDDYLKNCERAYTLLRRVYTYYMYITVGPLDTPPRGALPRNAEYVGS